MDIQRRKPPHKKITAQGGVQFRERVFHRTSSESEQQRTPQETKQGLGSRNFFDRMKEGAEPLKQLSKSLPQSFAAPKKGYKTLAEKSRAMSATTRFAQSLNQGKEEKKQVVVSPVSVAEKAVKYMPQGQRVEGAKEVFEKVDQKELKKHESKQAATTKAMRDFSANFARTVTEKVHVENFSHLRIWQFSMIGAMLFGMFSMSVIMWNFGQSVEATDQASVETLVTSPMGVLVETSGVGGGIDLDNALNPAAIVAEQAVAATPVIEEPVPEELSGPEAPLKSPEQVSFESRVTEMVAGYPIEAMLSEIFKQDMEVAAYIIGIAKIESAWGERVPVLKGEDCYNYWGYRAKRERMGTGGHTCFDDYADAVETIGTRIENLVYKYEKKTPRDMLVWKCGSSCESHDPAGVERWVSVVSTYKERALGK